MKNGWQTKTLGEVAVIGAGNSAPQDEALFEDGTIPFFRTADAGRIRFGDIAEAKDYLNDKGVKGLRCFAPGTILFPKSGASTFLNHRVMLAVEGFVSSHLATIVADEKQAHPRFLLYFLSTIAAQDLVQDHAYPSLNLPTIAGIEVHMPPLPEQQRIVGILDEAFAGLATAKANAEKNLQNARALFESHLQSVFTQRGPGWVEKRVNDLATKSLGKMLDRAKNRGDLQPYLRNLNVRWFEFDLSDLSEMPFEEAESAKYTTQPGDVMICEGGYPGRAAVWEEEFPIYFQKAIHRVRFHQRDLSHWFVYYLYHCNSTDTLRQHFTGSGIQHFTGQTLARFTVPVPPLPEITQFVARFHSLREQTQRLAAIYEQKLAALEALKKSLLHQAFSGQL